MITINIEKSKMCNGDYSLFVSFPYNTQLLDIVRAMPSRYWDKDNKVWEIPANKLKEFVGKLSGQEIKITGLINEAYNVKREICKLPANFAYKTTPYQHQQHQPMLNLENDVPLQPFEFLLKYLYSLV